MTALLQSQPLETLLEKPVTRCINDVHMTFQLGFAHEACPPKVFVEPAGAGSLPSRPTAIWKARLRCKSSLQHSHAKVQHTDVAVIGAGKLHCVAV